MSIRAFVAVPISVSDRLAQLLADISSESARAGGTGGRTAVRAVAAQNLHLTLHFFGDIDPGEIRPITDATRAGVGDARAFDMRLQGLGAFPNERRPSVVWLGAAGAEPLTEIVARLAPALQAIGFPPDAKPWRPHVTIARVKGRTPTRFFEDIDAHREDDFGAVHVSHVDVMRSDLGSAGALYSTLASVPLLA